MNSKKRAKLFITLSILIGLAIASPQRADNSDTFQKTIQPFLATNCYGCHNSSLKSGGLNLEAYKTAASVTQDRERWERVLQKLRAGEMPPKGMPRPDKAAVEAIIHWIEGELGGHEPVAGPHPGRVTAHRLNRAEYNNSVRDLLGVDLRPADDFPQDDSG